MASVAVGSAPLLVLSAAGLLATVYWHWIAHVLKSPSMSGDKWYLRRMAFTDDPISPPYCWRPLVPWIARWTGFKPLSYTANFASVLVLYAYVGGGWPGCAVALFYMGNIHTFRFHIKNPEYVDAVGQLLMFLGLWALREQSPWIFLIGILVGLARETPAMTLAVIAAFWYPPAIAPIAVGLLWARFARQEAKDNRHPLVEDTAWSTVCRWAKVKSAGALHWGHTVAPLRGSPYAMPFMWHAVGDFARLGAIGFVPIWLLALPASGQSRIMCYGIGLVAPFIAAANPEWQWIFAGIAWFWPVDITTYDETGDKTFGYAR